MRYNDIIDLQETSPNHWRAKYQGNYGVYTIKIAFDSGGKTSSFSCSCPSDYYPCKHIGFVKTAIAGQIDKMKNSTDTEEKSPMIEDLLNDVTPQELRDFVVRQTKYNPDLTNAIKLEFAHKKTVSHTNIYSDILREEFANVCFDESDYDVYSATGDNLDLNFLEEWLERAESHVEQKNYHEAILICKACIEELADWIVAEDEVLDYVDESYRFRPFQIMKKAVENFDIDVKELYAYCISEMEKDKYSEVYMFNEFNNLLLTLAIKGNMNEFTVLQEQLLEKINDKASFDAERILKREISFYQGTHQPEKADALIENNIQIANFCYQMAEKRFNEQNFAEARRLINEFLSKKNNNNSFHQQWKELLLKIAQKENDIPVIRSIAFGFIESSFNREYFSIYKSAFTPDEWKDALENILQHYENNKNKNKNNKNRWYGWYGSANYDLTDPVVDVLIAEKSAERLILYIEKDLSLEKLEKYHKEFAESYPEKTLEMFKKLMDKYVADHTKRSHYDYAVKLLKQMRRIKGGDKIVAEMIARYTAQYKTRKVMLEMFNALL